MKFTGVLQFFSTRLYYTGVIKWLKVGLDWDAKPSKKMFCYKEKVKTKLLGGLVTSVDFSWKVGCTIPKNRFLMIFKMLLGKWEPYLFSDKKRDLLVQTEKHPS